MTQVTYFQWGVLPLLILSLTNAWPLKNYNSTDLVKIYDLTVRERSNFNYYRYRSRIERTPAENLETVMKIKGSTENNTTKHRQSKHPAWKKSDYKPQQRMRRYGSPPTYDGYPSKCSMDNVKNLPGVKKADWGYVLVDLEAKVTYKVALKQCKKHCMSLAEPKESHKWVLSTILGYQPPGTLFWMARKTAGKIGSFAISSWPCFIDVPNLLDGPLTCETKLPYMCELIN